MAINSSYECYHAFKYKLIQNSSSMIYLLTKPKNIIDFVKI